MPIETLKDKMYNMIKEEIISAVYKPGDYLLETELAEQYSVSRTPIREALNILCNEGFIESVPKNGYRIKSLSYKEQMEIFYLRIILEGGASALAAKKITDKDIMQLEKMCIYLNEEAIWEYNIEFHRLIAQISGNERLKNLIFQTLDEVKRILILDPTCKIREDDTEHIKIIEALKLRDGELARMAMVEHLTETRKRIYEKLNIDLM